MDVTGGGIFSDKISIVNPLITTTPTTQLLFDANNIDNNGGYNIDFKTSSNDTANRFMARIQTLRGSGATSSLGFFTDTGSALNRALLLDSSQNATFAGDVGIGASPTAGYNLDSVRTTNGYSIVGRHASGGQVGIHNSTGDNGIGTINNYPMTFFTNNSGPQVTLKTSGNVTLNVATALDFQVADFAQIKFRESGAIMIDSDNDQSSRNFAIKDGSGTNLLVVQDTGAATFAGDLTIGALTSGQTAQLEVNHDGGSTPVAKFMARTNKAIVQISDNDTTGYVSAENGLFSIGRAAGVNAANINIDAANEVGIGTSNPVHKLDLYANQNIPFRIHRPNNANLDTTGAWGIGFSTRGDGVVSTTDTRAGIFSYYNGNLFLATSTSAIDSNPYASARLIINNLGNASFTGNVFVKDGNKFFGANSIAASSEDGNYVASFGKSTNGSAKFAGNIDVGLGNSTFAGLVKINPGTDNNTSYDALVLSGGANSTSGSGAKMYLSGTVNDPIARGTIIEGLMTDNSNGHALIFSTSSASDAPTERMRITSGGVVEAKAGFSATKGTAFVNVRDNGDGGILSSESAAKTIGMCAGSNYASGANFAFIKFTGGASSAVVVRSNNNGVQLTRNSTAWTSASDETLKENIKPLENVLDKIQNYRCVEYNFKTDKDKKIGFIAQDWENDFAPIVNKDDEGLLGIKYTETIPVLLKAIQELTAKVEMLEKNCKCKN